MRRGLAASVLTLCLGLAAVGIGHTAFSAPSQDARAGFDYFRLLAEPVPLPDAAVEDGRLPVNVWATWCAPCLEEMPCLDALESELGGSEFEVVVISTDRTGSTAVRPFFEKTAIRPLVPYVDPDGACAEAVKANARPVSFLVKDGMIIGKAAGPEDRASAPAKDLIRAPL